MLRHTPPRWAGLDACRNWTETKCFSDVVAAELALLCKYNVGYICELI